MDIKLTYLGNKYTLTTDHTSSSYGVPVLICHTDNMAYGCNDFVRSTGSYDLEDTDDDGNLYSLMDCRITAGALAQSVLRAGGLPDSWHEIMFGESKTERAKRLTHQEQVESKYAED
jgi:hypothetical protein